MPAAASSQPAHRSPATYAATDRMPRRVPVPALRPDLAACVPTGVTLGAGTRVVVMPDGGGVAEALVDPATRLGVDRADARPRRPDRSRSTSSLARRRRVHGVYWLPALDDEGPLDDLDLVGWRAALRRRVRGLYTTMRRLLRDEPVPGDRSRLGGYHGYDEAGATCPLGGAVTGFAKAYRRERPDALVKAVDFAVGRKTAALADLLVDGDAARPRLRRGRVCRRTAVGRRPGRAAVPAEGPPETSSARTPSSWSPVRPAASCRRSPPTWPSRVAAGRSTCST